MKEPAYSVGIIVDPQFGQRLDQLASRLPIWIVDTPVNRQAAERRWQQKEEATHTEPGDVTTFTVDTAQTPEEWCASVLGVVDAHHDEYSHNPPYDAVEVVGAQLTDPLLEALSAFGLTEIEPLDSGFRARRVRPTL
jgi:hypothetical protein